MSGFEQVARFATSVVSEVAQRTRANRRGKLLEKVGDQWIVQYGRGKVKVSPRHTDDNRGYSVGLTVTLELVDGVLQISGPSAWQKSFDVPS